MTPKELLSILEVAGRLKKNTRHCYTDTDRKESVADHCWRISLLAMLLSGEEDFKNVDMDRVIRMCLIHDLGEAFTGDIPTFLKNSRDEKTEEEVYNGWVASFPSPQREEWQSLLSEMKAMESREARIYKALDKLEAVISHNESDISTWLPLEYDLQLTYADEQIRICPELKELKDAVDAWTKEKIAGGEKKDGI